MKSFFKKKEPLANANKYYVQFQELWVKKMNAMTCGLGRKKLIYLLILFVMLTSIWSMCLIFKGVSNSANHIAFGATSKIINNQD